MNGDEVTDAMDRDEDEELAEVGRALGTTRTASRRPTASPRCARRPSGCAPGTSRAVPAGARSRRGRCGLLRAAAHPAGRRDRRGGWGAARRRRPPAGASRAEGRPHRGPRADRGAVPCHRTGPDDNHIGPPRSCSTSRTCRRTVFRVALDHADGERHITPARSVQSPDILMVFRFDASTTGRRHGAHRPHARRQQTTR